MPSFAGLEECIQANISSSNNEIRRKAENHLINLKQKHPQQFFEGISSLIMQSSDTNVRSFSAVLLKQNLPLFDETFFKMPSNVQSNIKQLLLSCISSEKNENVQVQIAEAISRLICLIHSSNKEWTQLIPFLFSLSSSKDPHKRISFYICIEKLATNCIDILLQNGDESVAKLRGILIIGLQDNIDKVRECALSSIVLLLCSFPNETNEIFANTNIVPLLFKNIHIDIGDIIICKTCENLQILAENQPDFFKSSMNPIIECLVNVVKCNNLQWDTRKLAFNLLLTLLDFHCDQIANIHLSNIAQQIIPLLFAFLSDFNPDLDWDSPRDDVEQTNYIFAAQTLPIVVSIFGANIFLNTIQKPVLDIGFSDNSEWKHKLIALKTLEVTLEICVEQYEEKLPQIVVSIIKSLTDNNPHVKYAALSVIKQLSIVFAEDRQIFLIPFHEQIMSAFCTMLSLNNTPNEHRCVLIAISEAIAHFVYTDGEENEIIAIYSSSILNALCNLLKTNDNVIQSHALKAISVIIYVIQEAFGRDFYNMLMKYCVSLLQEIFSNKKKDESGALRGRCMECISNMLLVVDIEICRNDAHNIMKYMLPFQKQEQENATSESYTFMLSLFASCAEALTKEFSPYLQHVIPPLLHSAQKQTISLCSNTTNSDATKQGDGKMVVSEFGGIQFQVNTAEFNEKSIAVEQFPRYAVCMEGELLAFVKPISTVLKPILKTRSLSLEARRHAIETFVPLVNCLKCGLVSKNFSSEQVNKWVTGFVEELLTPLVEGMHISDEVDEFVLICKTIQDLLQHIDNAVFKNAEIVSDITEQIQTAISERVYRRKLNAEKCEDLIDEQVEEDVEADLADSIADLVASLVSKFGDKYIEIFDKHCGKQCVELLSNEYGHEADEILSLSLLTEIIRYGGQISNKYMSYVLDKSQAVLNGNESVDASAALLQSIAYAIGTIAMKKGLNPNNLALWLNLLQNNIINVPNSRDEVNISATENAISAIGKIYKAYEYGSNNNNKFITDWMQMLPLLNDNEERQFCNNYLLQILKQTSLLKGIVEAKNAQMINTLINVIAVGIVNEDKSENEFKKLFAHLTANCNSSMIQQSIASLSNDLQSALK